LRFVAAEIRHHLNQRCWATAGCYRALVSRSSSPAAVLGRAIATAGIVVAALSLGGCQSTANGQAILTDPAEIVMAGARSTAALHTVHVRMDMTFQSAAGQGLGGGLLAGRMSEELDADLDTRSFAGRSVTSIQGMPDMTSDMILIGGQQFSRNAPDTRWTQFMQFGAPMPFPSNDQLVEILSTVIQGGGVDLKLAEQQACGDSTCYHVIANVDPAVEWQLLAPLTGGVGAPPAGLNLPPITLNLLVDQATRNLVGGNTDISFQGVSASVTVTLTNHDAEIVIAAPPPALVDQMGNGFGGGIINDVGGGVAPVPMPAESVPAIEEPMPSG
jgi:hypothetical protein